MLCCIIIIMVYARTDYPKVHDRTCKMQNAVKGMHIYALHHSPSVYSLHNWISGYTKLSDRCEDAKGGFFLKRTSVLPLMGNTLQEWCYLAKINISRELSSCTTEQLSNCPVALPGSFRPSIYTARSFQPALLYNRVAAPCSWLCIQAAGITMICVPIGNVCPWTHFPSDICSPEQISLGETHSPGKH